MTKPSIICCFVLLTFLVGCASAPKERIAITPGREASSQPTAILADAIDRKIARLETLLKEKRIRLEDEPLAVVVINAYQSAKSCLDENLRTQCEGINHDLLQGLSLIDERYFSPSGNVIESPNAQADYQKESEAILSAYANKDYQGVIQRCTELTKRSGADALSSELQSVLALSLGAEHRYAEAVQAAEKALAGREALPDPIELRLKSAEWHLALGQTSETAALLNSVEQSMAATSLERKELEARITALKPTSPSPPSEASPDGQGSGPANPSAALETVEEMIKEGRLEEARSMLKENRDSIQSETQPETYELTLERLEKAEEQHLREQIGAISMKEQTLSRAKQLVEAEKFDEAIATIDSLGVEESVNGEAKAIIGEAVSGIVNRERNRAAKAFYSAKQTDDPIKKETYLRSSHDILKQLIDKYPSCNLIKKIKSNLSTVEAEMAKIGLNP
jgi:thioredoxin-like negative regulator of GroEL